MKIIINCSNIKKSMKSLLKLITSLFLIGVIFSACEKEEEEPIVNENAYVAFVGESALMPEGSILKIPVTMVAKATKDVDVFYKVEAINCKEGIDFSVVNSGTLVFPNGTGLQNIELNCIINDIVEEADRTVKLTLISNTADFNIGVENSSSTFTVTLVNDDEVSVNENAYVAFVEEAGSIEEGNDFQIPVVMVAVAAEDVTVSYKVETVNCDAGTDFSVLNSGYLVFPNGTGIQNIDLTCIDNDIFDEEERTVKLTLISNTADFNIGLENTKVTYTVNLVDEDDYVAFVEETGSVTEGNVLQIPVAMFSHATEDVTVNYNIEATTCVAGTDFSIVNSGSLVFSNGSGQQNIELSCIDNDVFEEAERTVKLTLTSNTGDYNIGLNNTQKTFTVTLVNNDEKPLEISDLYGTYEVSGTSYFDAKTNSNFVLLNNSKSSAIQAYNIEIIEHGTAGKVYIANYLNSLNTPDVDPSLIEAEVDLENMEFTILGSQEILKASFSAPEIGNNASVLTGYYDGENLVVGDRTGTISKDLTISFTGLASIIFKEDGTYSGVLYDLYTECVFTKVE